VAFWAVLGLSLLVFLFGDERLRPYRYTAHFVHTDSGVLSISLEPPEKPWRKKRKKEIEIGRRAIEVSRRVLAAVAKANQKMAAFPLDDENWNARQAAYQQTLHELQAEVGAEWRQVLVDLEALSNGALDYSRNHYEISINYTGLDTFAIEVEAAGRDLLLKNGAKLPPGTDA
jgi:hypothetical protein